MYPLGNGAAMNPAPHVPLICGARPPERALVSHGAVTQWVSAAQRSRRDARAAVAHWVVAAGLSWARTWPAATRLVGLASYQTLSNWLARYGVKG